MTRAAKTPTTPKSPGTTYEVSRQIIERDASGAIVPGRIAWCPVATITTTGGAPQARRQWAAAADDYDGEPLRAVPISNINEGAFDVAIERKLTPKLAPS